MIASLKPYPGYKDSGVPWMGPIPNHWTMRRAKYLFREIDDRSLAGDEPLLSLRQGGLVPHDEVSSRPVARDDLVGYKRTLPRDLVLNRMRATYGLLAKTVAAGIVSPDYSVFRPRIDLNTDYYVHLFRTPVLSAVFRSESTGLGTGTAGFLRLYGDSFGAIPVPAPSYGEQAEIVRYLARCDLSLHRIVGGKRRLIELLNEQKQAIIHGAVTRGLDPTVRLKGSRISWLGEMPEHWVVSALRMRYAIELGKMLDTKRITGSHPVRYLRNVDVQWDRVNSAGLPVMDIADHEHERYLLKPGDLLVCEGGDVGRSAFWDGALPTCGYQKALHRLRPHSDRDDYPRFLFYVLFAASKRGIFIAEGSENTIAHLTGEKLRRHRFAFPPRAEQEAIARYLDVACRGVTEAVDRATRHIQLLLEYRVRLAADVATGKLDVRGIELPTLDDADLCEDAAVILVGQGEDGTADGEEAGDADQ